MTQLQRLDHIAIAVRDTAKALNYFNGRLGLPVSSSEILESPHVRLTYLECGNTSLQLVEPLDTTGPISESLRRHGEGLHHICFGVEDVVQTAARLADPGAAEVTLGHGRGRPSAFVPEPLHHGVRIECTGLTDDRQPEG